MTSEMIPFLGVNHRKNSDDNRLSFDASKTGDCKQTRMVREGCDSTESGVCSFVLGTYSQRGSAPLPLSGHSVGLSSRVCSLKCDL